MYVLTEARAVVFGVGGKFETGGNLNTGNISISLKNTSAHKHVKTSQIDV